MEYEDPGWRPALGEIARYALIVPALTRRHRRLNVSDGLSGLRLGVLAIGFSVVLHLIPLSFGLDDGGEGADWAPWAVAGVGAGSLAGLWWARRRPLDASSEEALAALAGSYRGSLFIGLGLAQAPALGGLVAALFLSGRLLEYVLGLAFAMIGLAAIAPSRRDIARRQQEIAMRGSALSLGAALEKRPP